MNNDRSYVMEKPPMAKSADCWKITELINEKKFNKFSPNKYNKPH